MSVWPRWAETMGDRVAINPVLTGLDAASYTARFYGDAIPILNEYAAAVRAELERRGYRVTVLEHDESASGLYLGWHETIRADRGGIAVDNLLQWWAPREWTPAEFAARVDHQWDAARASALAQAPAPYPGAVTGPIAPLAPAAPAGPGPAPTVAPPAESVQPDQAPPAPDAGTEISPPADQGPYSFDEWNYVYQQQTGRQGPAPEAVGFPAERRSAPISREEWWSYAGPWFTASAAPGDGGGTGQPPSPAAPATELYSLAAAILFWLGLVK